MTNPRQATGIPGPPPRVLVVEADADDRALFREAVDELGLRLDLRFFDDPAKLLAAVQREPADLLLLELDLPGTTGFDLLGQLRAQPATRTLPVLVYTTSWHERDIGRAYQLGANGFLIKPLRYAELLDLLSRTFSFWLGACELPHRGAVAEGA
ncbi:MAG: response regulator [Alphaproteobacteria bacterium]|nr:response regulator [Alphaproteobacteria bacterium]